MRTVACAEEINPRTAKGMISIMPGRPTLGSWRKELTKFFSAQAKTEIAKAKNPPPTIIKVS